MGVTNSPKEARHRVISSFCHWRIWVLVYIDGKEHKLFAHGDKQEVMDEVFYVWVVKNTSEVLEVAFVAMSDQ